MAATRILLRRRSSFTCFTCYIWSTCSTCFTLLVSNRSSQVERRDSSEKKNWQDLSSEAFPNHVAPEQHILKHTNYTKWLNVKRRIGKIFPIDSPTFLNLLQVTFTHKIVKEMIRTGKISLPTMLNLGTCDNFLSIMALCNSFHFGDNILQRRGEWLFICWFGATFDIQTLLTSDFIPLPKISSEHLHFLVQTATVSGSSCSELCWPSTYKLFIALTNHFLHSTAGMHYIKWRQFSFGKSGNMGAV